MAVSISWAVSLIFQAMYAGIEWFGNILYSIDGALGFYLACFTIFVAIGILLMRLRGSPLMDAQEQWDKDHMDAYKEAAK